MKKPESKPKMKTGGKVNPNSTKVAVKGKGVFKKGGSK